MQQRTAKQHHPLPGRPTHHLGYGDDARRCWRRRHSAVHAQRQAPRATWRHQRGPLNRVSKATVAHPLYSGAAGALQAHSATITVTGDGTQKFTAANCKQCARVRNDSTLVIRHPSKSTDTCSGDGRFQRSGRRTHYPRAIDEGVIIGRGIVHFGIF